MVSLAMAQVPDAMFKVAKNLSITEASASHTQNQRIDAIANTGATQYNTTTHFMTDVFRPWGDSGNFQQVGIVKPAGWIVEAIDSPNYTCTVGEKFGPDAITCDPEGEYGPLTTENTGMPIRIRFRVIGACGTTAELSSTVANGVVEVKHGHAKSGVTWLGNSPWVKTTFAFPACPTGGSQTGGTPSSGSYTCDAAGLKQAVADSKVRFDKVPDGNAFYTWNDTNCRFPVTKATFNILNSLSNQSLYHNAHDYIEIGTQKVLWMVRPTTGCIWVQHDLAAGHQTLGQQGMSLADWNNLVNFNSTGISAYVWGGPCTAASSSSVTQMPALSIQKTAQGGVFTPGSTVSYTVTVTNVGQGSATDVYIDDSYSLYSNLELVSHPNCSTWMESNKPVLRCVLGELNPGQSKSVALSFRIPMTQACNAAGQTGNQIINTAGTTGKASNGVWLQPTWTPQIKTSVSCASGSSFSSVTWSTGPTSSSSAGFSSTTWSGGSSSAINSSNPYSSSSSTSFSQGNGQTSLSIEKTADRQSTKPGENITYTVTVRNTGSVATQNAYFDDVVHPNMFVQSFPAQCGLAVLASNDTVVRCYLGTIQPGQSTSRQLVFRTGANYACGNGAFARNSAFTYANNASTVSTSVLHTQVNCHGSSSTSSTSSSSYSSSSSSYSSSSFSLSSSSSSSFSSSSSSIPNGTASLGIEKTVAQSQTQPGQNLNYTVTVRNNGNVAAQNVYVDDYLHPNMFVTSVDANCNLAAGAVRCQIGTLQPGQSVTRNLVYRTDVNYACGNGSVARNSAGANASNATGVTTPIIVTPVVCQGTSSSSSSYSSSSSVNASWHVTITGHPSHVKPCEEVTYTIRITNNSSSTRVATVQQTIPNQTSFVSATDGGFESNGNIRWQTVSFNAFSTVTLTSRVRVSCSARDGDTLRSNVYVENSSAEAITYVRDSGSSNNNKDLSISVTDNKDPVKAGEELRYTIKLCNNNDRDMKVDVTARLDSDTTFVTASDDGDEEDDDEVQWDNIDIDDDSCETITLTVRVKNGVKDGDTLKLRVSAEGESDTENTKVDGQRIAEGNGDLRVFKTADRSEANPGDEVSYTITIRNDTAETLRNIRVTDSFNPSQLSIFDPNGGTMGNGSIQWTIDTLEAGQVRTIIYRGRLSSALRHGDTVRNDVSITGGVGASNEIRIVTRLPQTGIGDFFSPMNDGSQFLSPLGSSASIPAIAWTTVLMIGLSAGGMFGRRYFL